MKRRLSISLVSFLIVLALAVSVSAAETLLYEHWYVAEQEGKAVGYAHDRCWRVDDGFRYVSEGTLRVSMLGGPPVEVVSYLEAFADPAYLARSFKSITEVNGVRTQMTGLFGARAVEVTITTADGREQKTLHQTEEPLFFDFSFFDSIVTAGGLKPGAEYVAKIFDFNTFAPSDYELAVGESRDHTYDGRTVRVFAVLEKIEGNQSLVDENGVTYWGSLPKTGLIVRRVEKDQIPALETMSADVLLVPGNLKVLHPLRSLGSRVRVTWKDVPFAEFHWEDNRQKLLAHRETSEGQEVTVSIARDGRDFSGKVTLPVTGEEFAPYLGDAQYITPSLPEVQVLAREILAGEHDGWTAVRKLVKWVYGFIEPAMIPETLTTAQILERKQGKCAEYAILFAALARAAGLPTRVALGERYQGDVWLGHMWNEVWLGEWVAVDASHNQIAPDALLLKFVHSDNLMGTQKVRRGLMGQLGIAIEKIDMPPETAAGDRPKTGIEGQRYVNAEFECALIAPEGWKMIETSDQGFPMLVMGSASAPEAAAILFMAAVPTGTRPEQLVTARLPNLQASLPNCKVIGQEKDSLAELPVVKLRLSFTAGEQNIEYRREEWIAVRDDYCYLLIFMAPAGGWEAVEDGFESIRKSFTVF